MKRFLTVFGLFTLFFPLAAADIPSGWLTKLDAAVEAAKTQKKPIFVLISGTDWCPPCRALDKKVIKHKTFQRNVAKSAVGLYIDLPRSGASQEVRDTLKKMSFFRGGVPAYAVVNADLKVLVIPQKRTAGEFVKAVKKGASMVRNDKVPNQKKVVKANKKSQKSSSKKSK